MRDVAPTRSALAGLVEERQLMRQGHGFLDEKRMLLAGEILRLLKVHDTLDQQIAALRQQASEALANAVERHGLQALEAYGRPPPPDGPPAPAHANFLGVAVSEIVHWQIKAEAAPDAVDPSPQAELCRDLFSRWLEAAHSAGLVAGNLERLAREYRRVERRAMALENVLIPEVEAALKQVSELLDANDQEEAVRVHLAAREISGAGTGSARSKDGD